MEASYKRIGHSLKASKDCGYLSHYSTVTILAKDEIYRKKAYIMRAACSKASTH